MGFECFKENTMIIAIKDRRAMDQKSPWSPILELIIGPNNSESIKAAPIWKPTKAFAFALFSSLIESARNAIRTADIAPPPWSALPITTRIIFEVFAAKALPKKKDYQPNH